MVTRWALALVIALAGCGRLHFDALPDLDACSAGCTAWVLEQHAGFTAMGSATLSVTVGPTTAGDLIVVAVQAGEPSGVASIDDNAGTAYQRIAASSAVATAHGGLLEIWYAPAANAGATTISVTANLEATTIVAWEFRTPRAATVDVAGQLSDQPATASPTGPALTTQRDGELVISATVLDFHAITDIAAGEFTNDELTNANGWAHITDPSAPAGTYQATWTADIADTYCATAAAFVVD